MSVTENFSAIIPLSLLPDDWMLGIRTTARGLSGIEFLPLQPGVAPRTVLAERVARQLENYFADPEWQFEVPLDLQGSEFQLRVWRCLGEIPSGRPLSYSELAASIGSGARAVGRQRLPQKSRAAGAALSPCGGEVRAGWFCREHTGWIHAHQAGPAGP